MIMALSCRRPSVVKLEDLESGGLIVGLAWAVTYSGPPGGLLRSGRARNWSGHNLSERSNHGIQDANRY